MIQRLSTDSSGLRAFATIGVGFACALVFDTFTTATAEAQEQAWRAVHLEPPSSAFEVAFGTGYAQGIGRVTPARTLTDVSGGGAVVEAGVGYRVRPRWSLGVQGGFEELTPRGDTAARAFSVDAGVTIHARPASSHDPWLRIASGYRMFGDVNTQTTLVHAYELARVTLGYDFRVDSHMAFAPVVGGDVDLFDWQYAFAVHQLSTYARPQVGGFLFAGLQARFDVGSTAHWAEAAATR
jgi:hypothetical protein